MMNSWLATLGAAVLAAASVVMPAAAQPLAAEILGGNDEIRTLDMSPNGERVAMLMRRERAGEYELLIFDTSDIEGSLQAIQTDHMGMKPLSLFWSNDEYLVVSFYRDVRVGSQEFRAPRLASYHVDGQRWQSMMRTGRGSPLEQTSRAMAVAGAASLVSRLVEDPDHVIVAQTEAMGRQPVYYRTNVANGNRQRVLSGTTRFDGYVFDSQGEARGATGYDAARNRVVYYARTGRDDDWREIGALEPEGRYRFSLLGFFDQQRLNEALILADEPGHNTSGIYAVDIRQPDQRELLFRVEEFDAVGVITSPRPQDRGQVVGFRYADFEGVKDYYLDEELAALHQGLESAFPERSVSISRVSEDGRTLLVYTSGPRDPGSWFLIRDGNAARIASRWNEITPDDLSPARAIVYEARDGRMVSGIVTIPEGDGPFPAIAMPHGGPWVRDTLGYDRWAQMLANRGYVVFQPNYRGSTLLGRDHWLAGDQQWGLAMQDDVEDGMLFLVSEGIADENRMAIFGWSYGGYSAFVAATRNPSIFNCSVAGAGVSDIRRIRGGLTGSRFLRQFQQPTIDGVSPIEYASTVTMPMLIVHGDDDTTVPVEHSRRFVQALRAAGTPHTYIEIEGMGHGPIFHEENMQWFPQLFEFFETQCGF
ncbi:MAG: S9 family peptidase [Oceanicaulis sp.]|nr:S9 family peptidase [Oceanicaulis sp.]